MFKFIIIYLFVSSLSRFIRLLFISLAYLILCFVLFSVCTCDPISGLSILFGLTKLIFDLHRFDLIGFAFNIFLFACKYIGSDSQIVTENWDSELWLWLLFCYWLFVSLIRLATLSAGLFALFVSIAGPCLCLLLLTEL